MNCGFCAVSASKTSALKIALASRFRQQSVALSSTRLAAGVTFAAERFTALGRPTMSFLTAAAAVTRQTTTCQLTLFATTTAGTTPQRSSSTFSSSASGFARRSSARRRSDCRLPRDFWLMRLSGRADVNDHGSTPTLNPTMRRNPCRSPRSDTN